MFVIRNKKTGEFYVDKGETTKVIAYATWFNADAASRFLRKARHPGKWEKVEIPASIAFDDNNILERKK